MASFKRVDELDPKCSVNVEYDDVDGDGWRIKKIAADNKGIFTLRISFKSPVVLDFIVKPGDKLAESFKTGEKTKVTVKTTSKSVSKVDVEQLNGIVWMATYGV